MLARCSRLRNLMRHEALSRPSSTHTTPVRPLRTTTKSRPTQPATPAWQFSLRLADLAAWRATMARLYTADAVFDYPAAVMHGRDDILRFWTAFLVMRWMGGGTGTGTGS